VSIKEKIDESTDMSSKIVSDWRRFNSKQSIKPAILIKQGNKVVKEEELFIGSILNVGNHQEIKVGDVLCRIPKDSVKTKDITGGLPRIAELFEARHPKNYAVMSAIDGTVKFSDKDYKTKKVITIVANNKKESDIDYIVPKGRHLFVNNGDAVKRGDIIMDGVKIRTIYLKFLALKNLLGI
jgi:hypothetical protein